MIEEELSFVLLEQVVNNFLSSYHSAIRGIWLKGLSFSDGMRPGAFLSAPAASHKRSKD